jgi:hypothetical protein
VKGIPVREVNIEFLVDEKYEGIFPAPEPASKFIPDFYQSMSGYTSGDPQNPTFNQGGDVGLTMKRCMPIFDSMTAGYVIPVMTDIHCSGEEGKSFTWPVDNFSAIQSHPAGQFPGLTINEEYDSSAAYKFINPWQIKTPPGYSCLFIQPMWRYDLPYHIFPGIVDTDKHPLSVNFPFIMRKSFAGYIKKGTPMVQVIPFKREPFYSSRGVRSPEDEKKWSIAKLQFMNRYKEHFRSSKSFR